MTIETQRLIRGKRDYSAVTTQPDGHVVVGSISCENWDEVREFAQALWNLASEHTTAAPEPFEESVARNNPNRNEQQAETK